MRGLSVWASPSDVPAPNAHECQIVCLGEFEISSAIYAALITLGVYKIG
jgi:hypothetical protein